MRSAILLGRLCTGLESDHGSIVHAIVLKACKRPPCPYNDFGRKVIPNDSYHREIALCGAKPGKSSVGWSYSDLTVTCKHCLKHLNNS